MYSCVPTLESILTILEYVVLNLNFFVQFSNREVNVAVVTWLPIVKALLHAPWAVEVLAITEK